MRLLIMMRKLLNRKYVLLWKSVSCLHTIKSYTVVRDEITHQYTILHSYSVLHRPRQHLCPHCDVLLLRSGCGRPSHAEVPVVETIPHVSAAGEWLVNYMCYVCLRSNLVQFWTSSATSPGAVSAVSPAHRIQPVHRVRLPRQHEHGGV